MAKVRRYLYTSSACIYPENLQKTHDVTPLKEDQGLPAAPEKGYGWEKLFAEQLTEYYCQDYGLDVRIVRFHNVYGPQGTWQGGKEKVPAAICRKVAEAEDGGGIAVWGDGQQTRSFCYIDDCIEGLHRIMQSGYQGPLNLGRDDMVTIDQLVDTVCLVANKNLQKNYHLNAPQGVRGRNSDNTLLQEITHWQPGITLAEGIAKTYAWIAGEVSKKAIQTDLSSQMRVPEEIPINLNQTV